jgi:hypothetical protein
MEAALAEATAHSARREREYVTLRDALRSLTDSFRADHAALRDEMRKREERARKEAEEVARKYGRLVEEVREAEAARLRVKEVRKEEEEVKEELREEWAREIRTLRETVERSGKDEAEALRIARSVVHLLCSS